MGGHLKAGSRIVAFDVGVPTSGKTTLEAGQDWVRGRRLKDLNHEIELCRPEIDRLESELVRVANNPAFKGRVEEVKVDLYNAWERLKPLEAARTELAQAAATAASIEVHGTIQARVRLDVDGVSYEIDRTCAKQRFISNHTKNEVKQEDLK